MNTNFRAWDKELKEMAKVISLSFYEEDSPFKGNETEAFIYYEKLDTMNLRSFDAIELMQYTNLNDSEDTEIYKGDIGWDDVRERYGIVDFIDGKFGYVSENDYEDLCEVCNDIVIRGNIYQNKELLEGE